MYFWEPLTGEKTAVLSGIRCILAHMNENDLGIEKKFQRYCISFFYEAKAST